MTCTTPEAATPLFNRYNPFDRSGNSLYGLADFSNAASFMQGIYNDYSALTPGSAAYRARFWSYKTWGFYAQDDIRATSRLAVNVGLRYEFFTVPTERYNLESRFLNFADPTQSWTYGPMMRNPSLKNFSPRVGFAWDVTGKGKTAIRSGFGVYQEVGNIGAAISQQNRAMPPYTSQSAVSSNPTRQVLSLPLTFGPGDLANRLQMMAYDVQQPRSLQYNFTVEQQVPFGMGLSVSYVGFRGIHLWQGKEGNPIPPSGLVNGAEVWLPFFCAGVPSAVSCTGAIPNPAYQRVNPAYQSVMLDTTSGDSWYNSLQVVLNKRLGRGLEFQSAYTWSKSLDTTQGQLAGSDCGGSGEAQGASPLNSRLDKGPSCFDLTHNWHLNLLYHFPNVKSDNFAAKFLHGWWVGNIVTAQTGFAFTPLVNVNRSNSGVLTAQTGSVDRVNLGTATTSTTFSCSGTGSAFPGAPPAPMGT
jgi:TonB dependent receptor